jgi:hypothetical protein
MTSQYVLCIAKDTVLIFGITFLIILVSRCLMRIWSRQLGSWFKHCILGSVTWLSHTRHSPALHPDFCALWIQAAHTYLRILSMKIARLLKVRKINSIHIVYGIMVLLQVFLSPCG